MATAGTPVLSLYTFLYLQQPAQSCLGEGRHHVRLPLQRQLCAAGVAIAEATPVVCAEASRAVPFGGGREGVTGEHDLVAVNGGHEDTVPPGLPGPWRHLEGIPVSYTHLTLPTIYSC